VTWHRSHPFRPMLVLLAATVTVLLALPVGVAVAQYPPGEDFSVTCLPESPAAGETVTCSVLGAAAGESLEVLAASGDLVLLDQTLFADEDGAASFDLDVPTEVAGAAIAVTVSGARSGTAATTLQVLEAGAEEPTDDGPTAAAAGSIPRTGTEMVSTVLAGILLLWLGVALVVASRRRTHRRVHA
jgi:hypothetical protein